MKKKHEIEKEEAFSKRENSIAINKSMHEAMSDAFKQAKDEAHEKSAELKQKADNKKEDALRKSEKTVKEAKEGEEESKKSPIAAVADAAEKVITAKKVPIKAGLAELDECDIEDSDCEPMFDEDYEHDDGNQSECDEQDPENCKKMNLEEMSDIDLDEPDFDEEEEGEFGNAETDCKNDPTKCKDNLDEVDENDFAEVGTYDDECQDSMCDDLSQAFEQIFEDEEGFAELEEYLAQFDENDLEDVVYAMLEEALM